VHRLPEQLKVAVAINVVSELRFTVVLGVVGVGVVAKPPECFLTL
jgi:hypothetical protein